MTTEEKLLELHKKFARKDKGYWCIILNWWRQYIIWHDYSLSWNRTKLMTMRFCDNCPTTEYFNIDEVVGHPLILSDILNYLLNNDYAVVVRKNHILIESMVLYKEIEWDMIEWDISKPYLKDQSTEVINAVYNLLTQ